MLLQTLSTGTGGWYRRVDSAKELDAGFDALYDALITPAAGHTALPDTDNIRRGHVESGNQDYFRFAVFGALTLGITALAIIGCLLLWRRHSPDAMLPRDNWALLRELTNADNVIWMKKRITVIGREGDLDVVLDNAQISQPHATIELRNGMFYLRDMKSTNGTVLDSVHSSRAQEVDPLHDQPLRHGDIIRFGRARSFIFETLAGGQTVLGSDTRVLPTGCHFHATRPPSNFCAKCESALCSECFADHRCVTRDSSQG